MDFDFRQHEGQKPISCKNLMFKAVCQKMVKTVSLDTLDTHIARYTCPYDHISEMYSPKFST